MIIHAIETWVSEMLSYIETSINFDDAKAGIALVGQIKVGR